MLLTIIIRYYIITTIRCIEARIGHIVHSGYSQSKQLHPPRITHIVTTLEPSKGRTHSHQLTLTRPDAAKMHIFILKALSKGRKPIVHFLES